MILKIDLNFNQNVDHTNSASESYCHCQEKHF